MENTENNEEPEKILVKLYILNDDGQWEDRITGNLFIGGIQEQNSEAMIQKIAIFDENDNQNPAYDFDVSAQVQYQLQQDTLIAWEESEREIAISFQSAAECQKAYEMITASIQLMYGAVGSSAEVSGDLGNGNEQDEVARNSDVSDMPSFTYENISQVASYFNACMPIQTKREALSAVVEKQSLVNTLVEIFKTCEGMEDREGCESVYSILKVILSFSRFSIYETMLNDENLVHIIGIMEYNPDISPPIYHRKVVDSSQYLEVIPFKNPATRELIMHTHRLQYLQDIVLPTPAIFEERGSLLTSFVYFRKNEIMEMIFDDPEFLPRLFESLINDKIDTESRQKMIRLFVELTSFSRGLQNEQKEAFISKILRFDILTVIDKLAQFSHPELTSSLIEMMGRVVEMQPDVLRQGFLASQERKSGLIKYVCDQFILTPDSSTSLMSIQIIKAVLDINNSSIKDNSSRNLVNLFVTMFYTEVIATIMAPIFEYSNQNISSEKSFVAALAVENVLDLLSICITFHTYHIKSYIFKSDILKNVAILFNSKYAFIAHAAIKVIRRALAAQNDFYNRYLDKERIIDSLVDSMKNYHMRYDIVNSAIIECFEFIRMASNRALIVNIVERHRDFFETLTFVPVFRKLVSMAQQIVTERDLAKQLNNKNLPRGGDFEDASENAWFDEDEEPGSALDVDHLIASTSPNKNYLSSEEYNLKLDKPLDVCWEAYMKSKIDNEIDSSETLGVDQQLDSAKVSEKEEDILTSRKNSYWMPFLRPKVENEDDDVVLRPQIKSSHPTIKVTLKRKTSTESATALSSNSLGGGNKSTISLVDYPDDEESHIPLPPCDDYTIVDETSSDTPSPKKSNVVDTP